ncbi:hypothetical protein BDY19DRAFT_994789 [Irpex rosettiformis]|uniref:Uncharacterized protein n=1 Tax=Irpex rosettiformis TaxID=378272 RepID=A0ACB8U100_9APHY|nr:hypothetical protein BDY19DRAFT_994789 [Irpex rosettiformis]
MQALLGYDTLYRQNSLNELHQARQPLFHRKSPKPKKMPSRLNLRQEIDDTPPKPLPKSSRHLPQSSRDQLEVKTKKAPPVPPLMLDRAIGKGRDIPPTPPPKSARHLRRIPNHREPRNPDPVPALPALYMPSANQRAQEPPQPRMDDIASRLVPATASTTAESIERHRPYNGEAHTTEKPRQLQQRAPPSRPSYEIYAESKQDTSQAPELRRSNSLPFLQRGLDPVTKLGKQYHPQRRPSIYVPAASNSTVPISLPTYTSGGVHPRDHHLHSTPAIIASRKGHRPPPINTTASGSDRRTPIAFVEREARQPKSVSHAGTCSSSGSRTTCTSRESGDVWPPTLQDFKMVRYAAASVATNPEKTSRARGEYLRTHFKNMREVAAALTGLKLTKAYTYLGDVSEHKQIIPFRRFAGGVGRASQAKQFKATQGRWPEKSVKFITRLLKNAESNADAKNLDVEDLFVKSIVVQQAPKTRRRTYRAHGRINPYQGHPCHVEIILSSSDSEVERAKDKDVVAASSFVGLNRRQVARRRIEAARV